MPHHWTADYLVVPYVSPSNEVRDYSTLSLTGLASSAPSLACSCGSSSFVALAASSAAGSVLVCSGPGAVSGSGSSKARSPRRSGRKRSIRFQVSVHSCSLEGSCFGDTRNPLLAIKSSTFLRFSRTASSYENGSAIATGDSSDRSVLTKLSPCPLFINRSMMSTIFIQRSSIPSDSWSTTMYRRNTLHSREEA